MSEELKKSMISIVSPVRNEEENLPVFYKRIVEVMEPMPYEWELVFVHDTSSDNTYDVLMGLYEEDKRVKIVQLTRGFGKENAITAGFDHANGDAAILIDADLQDPPELIPELLIEWQSGIHMVYAMRDSRHGESWFKKKSASTFYALMDKISFIKIPRDTGDYRLIDRMMLDDLKELKETHRFMKGLFMLPGYESKAVHYERDARHMGETNFSYWRLWKFAMDGVTGFSIVPLQIAWIIGLLMVISGILWSVGLLFGSHGSCDLVMLGILLFGGVQLITIGILGEYIGRIYHETKRRPLYVVKDTFGLEKKSHE